MQFHKKYFSRHITRVGGPSSAVSFEELLFNWM